MSVNQDFAIFSTLCGLLLMNSACERNKGILPPANQTVEQAPLTDPKITEGVRSSDLAKPEPYAPIDIAWQDIHLGMTVGEFRRCIQSKIAGELKNEWKDDGSIKTVDGKPYFRFDYSNFEAKENQVLDNSKNSCHFQQITRFFQMNHSLNWVGTT